MRIYIVRHGQTVHNVDRRIQGPLIDDPLNEHGVLQAGALEQRFARAYDDGLRIDAVYASPLQRAWMTAEALARGARVDHITPVRELQEFSWGTYLGQKEGAVLEGLTEAHAKWASGDLDYAPPEGESPRIAWARLQAALDPILARHIAAPPPADGRVPTVVFVAHGRINKILLSGLVDGDLTRMEAYPQGNTAVTLLERAPALDVDAIEGVGGRGPVGREANGGRPRWLVRALNDQSHLKGDAADPVPMNGDEKPLV